MILSLSNKKAIGSDKSAKQVFFYLFFPFNSFSFFQWKVLASFSTLFIFSLLFWWKHVSFQKSTLPASWQKIPAVLNIPSHLAQHRSYFKQEVHSLPLVFLRCPYASCRLSKCLPKTTLSKSTEIWWNYLHECLVFKGNCYFAWFIVSAYFATASVINTLF